MNDTQLYWDNLSGTKTQLSTWRGATNQNWCQVRISAIRFPNRRLSQRKSQALSSSYALWQPTWLANHIWVPISHRKKTCSDLSISLFFCWPQRRKRRYQIGRKHIKTNKNQPTNAPHRRKVSVNFLARKCVVHTNFSEWKTKTFSVTN